MTCVMNKNIVAVNKEDGESVVNYMYKDMDNLLIHLCARFYGFIRCVHLR